MTHTDNVRDPRAIEGLIPYMEMLRDGHKDMYAFILAVKDNEGSRDALITRYSVRLDLLRREIGGLLDLQREVNNAMVDKMEEVGEEVHAILSPQRPPCDDEHR